MQLENYIAVQDTNIIEILVDRSCSMASVEVNGDCFMMGNFWDFHNGCAGLYDIPDFKGYTSLALLIENYILSKGKDCKVIQREWNYYDDCND